MPPCRKIRRRGYTLVELVVSMAVATVLMGGLASAIVLASHAMPNKENPAKATLDAHYAAEQIAGELFCAQSFSERTTTSVEFTVADRDGDSFSETIRYAWPGTPGDPLTRQYNSGTTVEFVPEAYEFTLAYNYRQESTTTTETVVTQSPEIGLASFISWSGAPATEAPLSPVNWMAEYFQITPPAEVTTMNISTVKLMARSGFPSPGATITIGIHPTVAPGDPTPQSNPIGTPAVLLTSTLSLQMNWANFTFSDVVIDTSQTEYVIVVKTSVGGTAYLRKYYLKTAPADTHILTWTDDAGGSWDPRSNVWDDYDMPFMVYGTYETETTEDITTTRYFLQSTGISLRSGPTASTRVDTAVQVLNEPEVPGL